MATILGAPLAAASHAVTPRPLVERSAPQIQPTPPPRGPGRIVRTPRRPSSPAVIQSLRVDAKVVDGVATTSLVFDVHNPSAWQTEAHWVLPLPKGATADGFTMTVNGQVMEGEVLDAGKARGIYTAIVRRRRDPGLLEYMGSGCLRARIFPVPPRGNVKVNVRWRQLLPEMAGMREWRFPLRALRLGGRPPAKVAIDWRLESRKPVRNVYSPQQMFDVARKGDHRARASLEMSGDPVSRAKDPSVFYGLSEREFGLDMLAFRREKQPGYFMMLLSPKQEWSEDQALTKSIQFVIDTSGSMSGQKIEQARKAARFFIHSLREGDSFNVVPFSVEARPFFEAPVAATKENREIALSKVDAIQARGGTNIEEAMRFAVQTQSPEALGNRVPMVVFLTDGLPTLGNTDANQLVTLIAKENRAKSRVFVFGVGNDVNTMLLDKMADQNRGARNYVAEGQDIEAPTGELLTKLSYPVLSDLSLSVDGVEIDAMHPKRLPDLFRGSRLVVVGRYHGKGGHHAIRLRGKRQGAVREFIYEAAFPAQTTQHDFVPTMWARQRVAFLLDAIRLNGRNKELVAEVERLGKEFAIVTPFTSHLVVEESMRLGARPIAGGGGRWNSSIGLGGGPGSPKPTGPSTPGPTGPTTGAAPSGGFGAGPTTGGRGAQVRDRGRERLRRLGEKSAGRVAVAESKSISRLRSGGDDFFMGGRRAKRKAPAIARRVKDRTFYRVGDAWVDSGVTAALRKTATKITTYSDEYFALLHQHPDLTAYLALGEHVWVVIAGKAIEVVAQKEVKETNGQAKGRAARSAGTNDEKTPGAVDRGPR